MKKLLFITFSTLIFLSCEKPKKTYYSVEIVKDSFGGKTVFKEKIDTLLLENDSMAMVKNYTNYLISKSIENESKGTEFSTTEIIDYKLLDANKKVIVSTLSDKVKAELEKDVKKVINSTNTKPKKTNPEDQFSKLDGSHNKLTEYIKSKMNDPDSYEHVSTKAATKNDHIFVVTTIRGNNSYGATITTTYQAKCDKDTGEVLSISQQ